MAIEQLLAPSFIPLNHAITKSPELNCSKKEAWLDLLGGIMYASNRPSPVGRIIPMKMVLRSLAVNVTHHHRTRHSM